MSIVKTLDRNGPLCPQSIGTGVVSSEHVTATRFANRLFAVLKEQFPDVGEAPHPVADAIYVKVVYEDSGMRLYHETATTVSHPISYMETYWWQCPLCGFVLPVAKVER
jgi:hypothetical protein